MIDRLNFYDIYAYLLPGTLLLILLWLPFGILGNTQLSIGSLFVGIVLGYLAGHVLQAMAREMFPSKEQTKDGRRSPSSILLDAEDNELTKEMKIQLKDQIQKIFNLDVYSRSKTDDADCSRRDAFHLCRARVVNSDRDSYAEQFQGMYALLRGCAMACLLAALVFSGITTSLLTDSVDCLSRISFLLVGSTIVFGIATWLTGDRKKVWFKLFGIFLIITAGYILTDTLELTHIAIDRHGMFLVILLIIILSLAVLFKNESYRFMRQFARTIYLDFHYLTLAEVASESGSNHED